MFLRNNRTTWTETFVSIYPFFQWHETASSLKHKIYSKNLLTAGKDNACEKRRSGKRDPKQVWEKKEPKQEWEKQGNKYDDNNKEKNMQIISKGMKVQSSCKSTHEGKSWTEHINNRFAVLFAQLILHEVF